MNISIRKEKQKDIEAIFKLNSLAFESDAEARLVDNLRSSSNLALSLVATSKNEVVGHIAFSPMKIPGFDKLKLVGLAPMAVHPRLQKQGIGTKLIKTGIELLKSDNVDAIFLLGHKDYYPRFGFVPSFSNFNIKSKYEVPDEVFMGLELKPDILDGIDGIVAYSKEFDSL